MVTIYRAINDGGFEIEKLKQGHKGVVKKYTEKAKKYCKQDYHKITGEIKVAYIIHERLEEANSRSGLGHWQQI